MPHRPGNLASQLNLAIWDKFKVNGIEIPFP
jgi:small-conductance mechanosensitive channel